MSKSKILYVTQSIAPFLENDGLAELVRKLSQGNNDQENEIRVFMPKFGIVNERRHQLHEVIRLSGMNLVINDMDMPLIIKVASIPKERMQVYFIDNEDYFKRKATYANEDGALFPDNDERALFFAKGVVETVKKLNWAPDIIHVHGWLASFLPLYLKTYYANEPLFDGCKVVTSVYNQGFEGTLDKALKHKISLDGIQEQHLAHLEEPNYINVIKTAIDHSDALITGSNELPEELANYMKAQKAPVLNFHNKEDFSQAYIDFYQNKVLGA